MGVSTKRTLPKFFAEPSGFRRWLAKNHTKANELYVGFIKRRAGSPCMTWPESVAEALCYGWIDGVRKRLDNDRYMIRFTPRKGDSHWSAVNIRLFGELEAAGRVTEAGREAFSRRSETRSRVYSYEQKSGKPAMLDETSVGEFKKNKGAWEFFAASPPSYQKKAIWWVISSKQDQTRARRLAKLITSSAGKKRLA